MGKSNALVGILAVALALAVAVIAFLMGKESGRQPPMAAAPAHAAAPAAPIEAEPARPAEAAIVAPAPEDLRGYFAAIESVQIGPGGDPNAFGQELITSAMKGDSSKIDALVADLAKAEATLRAIVPPPSAITHHQAYLTQIGESRRLMGKVARALGKGDPGALSDLAADAQAMQASMEVLQREEKALKARAGL